MMSLICQTRRKCVLTIYQEFYHSIIYKAYEWLRVLIICIRFGPINWFHLLLKCLYQAFTKPGKWVVMYLYFAYLWYRHCLFMWYFYWILELFLQCGKFCILFCFCFTYFRNINCEWTLTSTPSTEVNVSIVFVNLDYDGSVCYHSLTIGGEYPLVSKRLRNRY